MADPSKALDASKALDTSKALGASGASKAEEQSDRPESLPLAETLTAPKSVGSRELKTRLGTYLRLVKKGVTLIITERGRPVAELRPLSGRDDHLQRRLYELAAEGVIGSEVSERRELEPFVPIAASGSPASDAVIDQRLDRF